MIGIIALLISILLPALTRVRRSADQVQCAASLRQIGQFYQIYAAINRGTYPQQYDSQVTPTSPNGTIWVNWPFGNFGGIQDSGGFYTGSGPGVLVYDLIIKDPRVLYCPTLDRTQENTYFNYSTQMNNWLLPTGGLANYSAQATGPGCWYDTYTSYVFWAGLGDPSYTIAAVWVDPQYATEFAYSARSLSTTLIASDMIGASTDANWTLKGNHLDGRLHPVPNLRTPGTTTMMQGYGGNYLYNDGHVVFRRAEDCRIRFDSIEGGYETWLAF